MIVVKVGGSLFDHPRFGPGLRAYLDSLAPTMVLLVPGGGLVADAVRQLDRVHDLGEEASHWLALRALGVTARFLDDVIVGGERRGVSPTCSATHVGLTPRRSPRVLDCFAFAVEDESRPGALPHSWDVTSDSIAARVAAVSGAERLVLLKSADVPSGTPWAEAAAHGWVDLHFPTVAAELVCPVEIVNFRRVLESPELSDD